MPIFVVMCFNWLPQATHAKLRSCLTVPVAVDHMIYFLSEIYMMLSNIGSSRDETRKSAHNLYEEKKREKLYVADSARGH